DGLEPGFYVELQIGQPDSTESDYFAYVVSARDGRVLFRKNLTVSDLYSYRVWADPSGKHLPSDGPQGNAPSPHPTGTPNQYNPPFVAPSLLTVQNGPISTNDPWLPSGATATTGNNATAYADIASPNGFSAGDLRATLTGPLAFDRIYDTAQSPSASSDQRMAAITQLFYNVNFFHDWYYDKGFDERAGNGQTDNYGRGGLGNDELRAEAQDYSGKNNANMSTPSDGARPVMQMYVFDGGAGAVVQRNGASPTLYSAGSATFGPQSFSVTADMIYVSDGNATGGTVNDGCQTFTTVVTGKIAFVDRGGCVFTQKVQNAEAAGAVAVIIGNNTFGGANELVGTATPPVSIPALSVSRTSSTALKAAMAAGTVNMTLSRVAVTDRDGTIDNAIVAHEWGHYISNRLIGDGNGISNQQAVGMGEGWADFHALLMVVKQGDDLLPTNANFNGVYALAAYTSYGMDPNGYYFGIRRLPYSTDMAKNGLTFKHIQDGVPLPANVPTAYGLNGADNAEVHATGEVWATMLWECYAALLRDTTRLTFDQALERMRGYLVASYKLTPLMPTMVEARDAVLAAAAAQDPIDFALFSAAFARRGLGMKAVAPDRDAQDNKPAIESFITGNDLAIVSVKLDDAITSCDQDGILDNYETGRLLITVKNVGTGALTATTGTVTTSSPFVTLGNGGQVTFPASQPFGVVSASVEVSLKNVAGSGGVTFGVSLTDPTLAVAGPVNVTMPFRVNFDTRPNGSAMDDVEAPTSLWASASDPNGNTGSNWRRFEASATEHHWFGPNPSSPADTWLTSPVLNVAAGGNFVLTFQHRWEFEGSSAEYFDGGVIEISIDNGATWSDVGAALSPAYPGTLTTQGNNPLRSRKAFVGKSPGYPAFVTQTLNLGTTYAGKAIKLRFRIGSDDAAALKGWEVDNLDFAGLTTRPFPMVETDPNACSNSAPKIAIGPNQTVDEGAAVTLRGSATDSDGDAVTLTWKQTAGVAVALDAAFGFTAPMVEADLELSFELTASDGKATAGPAVQHVLVRNVNQRPVAIVPAAMTVVEGAEVTLVGSGTDSDGDQIVSWAWAQVGGPVAPLDGLATPTLRFVAPQGVDDATLTFELVVHAGGLASAPARVTVRVLHVNQPAAIPLPVPTKATGCGCSAG
ncbi:MAG: Peptidase, (Fungalysin) family, partial [Myxococcaceae bacterium]|nr:Peptidase, (Fungalysin) family [Myxococcaceae bacterium]